ncbi:hypothetical protein JCM6882_000251 [Rhodosporidiobolus microsporus]
MADWSRSLKSLKARLANLAGADRSPTAADLEVSFARFVKVVRKAVEGDGWKTSLDAVEAVKALMEGLDDALKPLDPKDARRRARSLAVEPATIVKPDEGDLPATPEEDENFNPFGGVLARSSSPAIKREHSPAPSSASARDPSPTPPPTPPAPQVKREASPIAAEDPEAAAPSPTPEPAMPSVAAADLPLNPLNLPLSRFPAVPVPSELVNSDTGLPVFDGPFIRQPNAVLLNHNYSWTDIGGSNAPTVAGDKICANEWHFNIPPASPGQPFTVFSGEWWHSEMEQGKAYSVFFKPRHVTGWHYQGEYEMALAEVGVIDGSQLGQLGAEEKTRWIDMFSPGPKTAKGLLVKYLSKWNLPGDLWGEEVWDAAVAAGAGAVFRFAVFRCVGFDAAKIAEWVAKRNERLALERELSAGDEEAEDSEGASEAAEADEEEEAVERPSKRRRASRS